MQSRMMLAVVLAAATLVALTYAAIRWTTTTATLFSQVDSKVTRQIERIDKLEEMISRLDSNLKRQERLAFEMAKGTSPEEPRSEVVFFTQETKETEVASEIAPDAPLDHESAVPLNSQDTLVEEFQGDWGQSDWGRSAAAAIEQSIPDHPFFGKFEGDFVTDCREKTCRVEWYLPDMDDLSQKDRDELVAMARYEMLALAAANATDVGQLTTEWTFDGNSRSISTTFRRISVQY